MKKILSLLFVLLLFCNNSFCQKMTSDEKAFESFKMKKQKTSRDYSFFTNLLISNRNEMLAELLQGYIEQALDSPSDVLYQLMVSSSSCKKKQTAIADMICDYYYAGGTKKYTKDQLIKKMDLIFIFDSTENLVSKQQIKYIKSRILTCYFNGAGW